MELIRISPHTYSTLLIVCLVVGSGHGAVQVLNITKLSEPVMAGTRVELDCTVRYSSEAAAQGIEDTVIWKKDGEMLYSNTKTKVHPVFQKDDLLRVNWDIAVKVLSPTSKTFTLIIPHVSKENAGIYSCQERSTSLAVKNPVIFAPARTDVPIVCDGVALNNKSITVTSPVVWYRKADNGSDVQLISCPVPTINGSAVSNPRVNCSGLSHLVISEVVAADDSTYTCSYNYTNTKPVSGRYRWSTDLFVKVKPNPPGKPEMVDRAFDSITVRWNASEATLTSAVNYYIVQHTTEYTFKFTKGWPSPKLITNSRQLTSLEYKIPQLDQGKKYVARVIAGNEVGFTVGETNLELETMERPQPPNVFIPKSKHDRITFTWSITGKVTSFLLKFYKGSTEDDMLFNKTIPANNAKDYEYTVENLEPTTEYCYTIQSVNVDELSEDKACALVKTDIAAPGVPKQLELLKGSRTNTTATVSVIFDPPECVVKTPTCLSFYILLFKNGYMSDYNSTTFMRDAAHAVIDSGSMRVYNLTGMELGYVYEMRLAGAVRSRIDNTQTITGNFSETAIVNLTRAQASTSYPTSSMRTTTFPVTVGPAKSADNTVMIAVISGCGILLLAAIVVIIIVVYKKRKGRGNMSVETEDDLWIDLNTPLLGPASIGYVENTYENVGIDGWKEHVKLMHANSDIKFAEEYESICQSTSQDLTWRDSLEPANVPKNRYNNIVAYDHTRVVLKTLPGTVHSDYINANYIDSYDKTRAFIATQGPLLNTIEDFWRMVWENNCSVLVMITNVYEKHKKKCEQYWPDSGDVKYGRLTVTYLDSEELAYWTIRRFTIKNNKVSKKKHQVEKIIVQYHYTEWPDHGIPEYTLPVLAFVKRACSSNPIQSGPVVVHCSAGVGRTGTFIVLEAMMKQIMQKRTANVQGFLRHIRGLRNHMVQTEDQYIFIHDALLNFIESGGRTDIQPKKFRTLIDELYTNFDNSGETILEKQYKTIVKWSPPEHLTGCAMLEVNQSKNRSLSYIPLDNSSRVKLPKVAGENGSDYINATYLHGHFQNKEFVITQHPAAHTEYDFWRMVWDQNSMTVVMLSNIGEEDLVTFYRPKGEATDWSHKSSFKLTFTEENLDMIDYTVRDFQLESKQDDYEMLTRMFSITCWPEAYTDTQTYSDGVFQFIEVVNKWHANKRNQTGPIIVIDKYGGKVASQFCALYTLYNQYHNDTTVDIYSLAYLYHMKRPGVWETQDDYRLLYNSMLQLCEPQLEDDKAADGNGHAKGEFAGAHTYANVRRINTLPRSPEHLNRTDTL